MAPLLSRLSNAGGSLAGFGFGRVKSAAVSTDVYSVITPLAVEDSAYFATDVVGDSSGQNYLKRTQVAGDRKTWTYSTWIRKGRLGVTNQRLLSSKSGVNQTEICIDSSDRFFVYHSSSDSYAATTNSFTNTAKWYHLVVSFDTTQSSDINRVKIWVDGVQETIIYNTAGSGNYIPLDTQSFININGYELRIGSYSTQGSPYLDAYLAHTYLIDGKALTPGSFAGYTSSAKTTIAPKTYSDGYGSSNNSFFLKYANSGGINGYGSSGYATNGIGLDSSGLGNTFEPIYFPTATVNFSDSKPVAMGEQVALVSFDGDGNGSESWSTPSGAFSFSPGLTYTGTAELKISGYFGYLQWKINGGAWNQVNDGLNDNRYVTVDTGGGTLSSFETQASSFTAPVTAVRIDGSELVDASNFLNRHSKDTPYNSSPGTDTGVGGQVKSRYFVLDPNNKSSNLTLKVGNQFAQGNSTSANKVAFCDTFVSSGKWYFEYVVGQFNAVRTDNNNNIGVGVAKNAFGTTGNATTSADSWIHVYGGTVYNNGSTASIGAFTYPGGFGMCAFDLDSGKIWFGKDGTWYNSGNPASGTNATYSNLTGPVTPVIWMTGTTNNMATGLCLGQRIFQRTAPSGFKVLCAANV